MKQNQKEEYGIDYFRYQNIDMMLRLNRFNDMKMLTGMLVVIMEEQRKTSQERITKRAEKNRVMKMDIIEALAELEHIDQLKNLHRTMKKLIADR